MLDYNMVVIASTTLLANTSYGLTAPILPQFLEDRGVASSWNGFIWASFSIAVILVSLIAGSIVDRVGHTRLMMIGTIVLAASIAAYSTAIYFDGVSEESKYILIGLATLLNIIQGK